MQTRIDYYFDLSEDEILSVCRQSNSVTLTCGSEPDEINIRFRPCHLPEIRNLVLELEALQILYRQKDEAASAVELKDAVTA